MNTPETGHAKALRWRLAGVFVTFLVIGLVSFGLWGTALSLGADAKDTWYWPALVTVGGSAAVFISPNLVGNFLVDLLKGFSGAEYP